MYRTTPVRSSVTAKTCRPTSAACIRWSTPTASCLRRNSAGTASRSCSKGTIEEGASCEATAVLALGAKPERRCPKRLARLASLAGGIRRPLLTRNRQIFERHPLEDVRIAQALLCVKDLETDQPPFCVEIGGDAFPEVFRGNARLLKSDV